eukprot:gene7981-8803_t
MSGNAALRRCRSFNLLSTGPIDYLKAWSYQKALVESCNEVRKASLLTAGGGNNTTTTDALLFVSHPPVYTLGRGADTSNIRFEIGGKDQPSVYKIERGGDVTFHGPGQLVIYPILDLNHHKRDLHWYVRTLEQSVIDVLRDCYGIEGSRDAINSGVFVNKQKICAVGMTASRWITMHGLALNVHSDLSYFQRIVPCGINAEGYGVCRLQDLVGSMMSSSVSVEKVAEQMAERLAQNFQLDLVEQEKPLETLEALVKNYPDIASSFPVKQGGSDSSSNS